VNPAAIAGAALAALLLTVCGASQSAPPIESVNDMNKPLHKPRPSNP